MIELTIPGRGVLALEHLVTDVNGTLAVDGHLIEGVARHLSALRDRLSIHLLTADTHGRQSLIDRQLGFEAVILTSGNEATQKADYVHSLGSDSVVAIGQGSNDAEMLDVAQLGICVMSQEGVSKESLLAADLVVPNIIAAFELLERPLRIVATLRK